LTNRKGSNLRSRTVEDPWNLLRQRKCHLEKGLGSGLPASIYHSLKSLWEPVTIYSNILSPLPTLLVVLWANSPGGHLLFSGRDSEYLPEAVHVGGRELTSVAVISVPQLIGHGEEPLMATGKLIDHLLGSLCVPGEPALTDGFSKLHPRLEEVGRTVRELWSLGYGPEWTEASPSDYFSWGFARFVLDRKSLNVADPLLEKLLRHTIFSDRFWMEIHARGFPFPQG